MISSWKCSLWLLVLAAGPWWALTAHSSGHSRGQMSVGLTLVAGDVPELPLPTPVELDHPASPNAVLCRSGTLGYRECRTPFHERALLSRELTDTRCIEGRNWGWRPGAVWVDGGCAAVFMKPAQTRQAPAA